ncbi:DNA adenine methylase [Campylobacter lari]|uniref:Site-specific DNA-methyltransferase (adenine-specific) n=1 Tax=Campylobacter lari TaxID=201 RepID=A0A5L4NR43_CAMLA|nr:DNA adenine methylase [Campylobacter sp. CNRCH_2013_0898h]EAI3906325.1 DNA adenine methylase [Campylobacter lari]EAI3914941.1 DNA adenine methylase [Campylobacter lari]EAJ6188698.1 DNA adenine methylase [Campylobacter lari]EAK0829209.1 DNA adenine methylase [Campylobacter lari]MCV3554082.1 DNA adenine methylase [Campylobacter sp. CNRCH_2013_0898h]
MNKINSNYNKKIKPFLKWAGGKSQLISEIEKYYPFDNKKITKYAEPFVGGGAVLFDILEKYNLNEIYISDINAELINTYCVIKDDISGLIFSLEKMRKNFISLSKENRKTYYLQQREKFNNLKFSKNESLNIEKAALMIFLNKSCFNGLYRVNKKGMFNVPMGSYKNPNIYDEENLIAISEKLKNVNIIHGDYTLSYNFIDENTFVYIDPPYRPLNNTSNFTSYTEKCFDDEEQIKLAEFIYKIHNKRAKIVISNSDPKNVDKNDDFFDSIYSSYNIERVNATRMISSKSSSRARINELLISNQQKRNYNA